MGTRSFPRACTGERRAHSLHIFSSIFFGNHATPRASLEVMVMQFISFLKVPAAGGERKPGKNSHGRWMGERRTLQCKPLKLLVLEFTLLRCKIWSLLAHMALTGSSGKEVRKAEQ